ncbi:DUF805 domain-containing protein [Pseudomonas sp. S9]|uniref:DUF805 domain-containing protein n=1 Tax=Pseudomonas sp. S9 TaxID=686578 RepID=UPI00025571FF|nr:DUF805 domain-containing protein [Pseudomonas sp. S9]
MTQTRFKIVFSGELMPGVALETAKDNLAKLFKSDSARVNTLFSGSPIALKRDLHEDEADKYLAALHNAGPKATKEPDLAASLSLVDTDEHKQAPESAETMQCPKCGHRQDKAIECSACGIVIEKFLARQALQEQAAKTASAATTVAPPPAAHTPYAPPKAPVGERLPEFGELKPFTTDGRIGRLRFLAWTFVLMLLCAPIFGIAAAGSAISATVGAILMIIVSIALVIVGVMINVQRLHDIGWSGWLLFITILPIVGSIFSLLMLFMPGTQGPNRYGPPPPPNSTSVKVLSGFVIVCSALALLGAIIALLTIPDALQLLQSGAVN